VFVFPVCVCFCVFRLDVVVPVQVTGCSESLTAHLALMVPGFACVPLTFPVVIVTGSTALTGRVCTHSLHFFTVRPRCVSF